MKTKYALLLIKGTFDTYMQLCSLTGETASMQTAFTEDRRKIRELKKELESTPGCEYKILTIVDVE